eukprot:gene9734-11369_t
MLNRDKEPIQTQYIYIGNKTINSYYVFGLTTFYFNGMFILQRNQSTTTLMTYFRYYDSSILQFDHNITELASVSNAPNTYSETPTLILGYTSPSTLPTINLIRAYCIMRDVSLSGPLYRIVTSETKINYPYPYGYVERFANMSVLSELSFPLSRDLSTAEMGYKNSGSTSRINLPIPPALTSLPAMSTFNILPFSCYSFIVRVSVSDVSGIVSVLMNSQTFSQAHLLSGSIQSGVYVFEVGGINNYIENGLSFSINSFTRYLNILNLKTNPINMNGDMAIIPSETLLDIRLWNLTHFEFLYPVVDLLDESFENSLYFNVSRLVKNAKPALILSGPFNYDAQGDVNDQYRTVFYGTYDISRDMYRIDFRISKNQMVGILPFKIVSSMTVIKSVDIMAMFGDNGTLSISSTLYGDLMNPLATAIIGYPSNEVTLQPSDVNVVVGWNITIEDYPNSFDYGMAEIISTLDNEPFIVHFNSSNLISGDLYNGVYSIRFQLQGRCKTQTYFINHMILRDKGDLAHLDTDAEPEECSKSSGLSTGKLAAIIACASLFGIGLAVGTFFFIRRQQRFKKQSLDMENRLEKMKNHGEGGTAILEAKGVPSNAYADAAGKCQVSYYLVIRDLSYPVEVPNLGITANEPGFTTQLVTTNGTYAMFKVMGKLSIGTYPTLKFEVYLPSDSGYVNNTFTMDPYICSGYTNKFSISLYEPVFEEQRNIKILSQLLFSSTDIGLNGTFAGIHPFSCDTNSTAYSCVVEQNGPNVHYLDIFTGAIIATVHIDYIEYNNAAYSSRQDFIQTMYFTVKDLNSVIVISNQTGITPLNIIKRNQTHATLFSATPYGSGTFNMIDTVASELASIPTTLSIYKKTVQVAADYKNAFNTRLVRAYMTLADAIMDVHFIMNDIPFSMKYPYGYTERFDNKSLIYETTLPVSVKTKDTKVSAISRFINSSSVTVTMPQPSVTIPVINSVKTYTYSSYSYIVTMNISDPSGIIGLEWGTYKIYPSSIQEGTIYNGIYMFEIIANNYHPLDFHPVIKVLSASSGSIELEYHATYNLLGSKFAPFITGFKTTLLTFELSDITHFEFKYPNVTLGDETFENTLYFNITNADNQAIPRFYINDENQVDPKAFAEDYVFYGAYDYTRKMYRIDFTISWQQNIGLIPFYLPSATTYITSLEASSHLGTELRIVSSKYNYINIAPTETKIVGWNITIEDYPNTFDNGVAEILSDWNNEPIIVKFNSTQRVDGDKNTGVYQILFPVHGKCKTQTYFISSMTLKDKGDLKLSSFVDGAQSLVGPSFDATRMSMVICSDTPDPVPPTMVSFTTTTRNVDVCAFNRTVSFQLVTTDTGGSGLSVLHLPYVYLTSEDGSIFSIKSVLLTSNSTHSTYNATSQLPYGFGTITLAVSVYGITDNHLNIVGYSTSVLENTDAEPKLCAKSSSLSTGKIVAIVVSVIVFVIAVAIGAFIHTKRQMRFKKQNKAMQQKMAKLKD